MSYTHVLHISLYTCLTHMSYSHVLHTCLCTCPHTCSHTCPHTLMYRLCTARTSLMLIHGGSQTTQHTSIHMSVHISTKRTRAQAAWTHASAPRSHPPQKKKVAIGLNSAEMSSTSVTDLPCNGGWNRISMSALPTVLWPHARQLSVYVSRQHGPVGQQGRDLGSLVQATVQIFFRAPDR